MLVMVLMFNWDCIRSMSSTKFDVSLKMHVSFRPRLNDAETYMQVTTKPETAL
jgi:hypothetical protein